MEREVGRGIGMGNTCKPMAVSFQCMTKSTTHTKKSMLIGLQCHCYKALLPDFEVQVLYLVSSPFLSSDW